MKKFISLLLVFILVHNSIFAHSAHNVKDVEQNSEHAKSNKATQKAPEINTAGSMYIFGTIYGLIGLVILFAMLDGLFGESQREKEKRLKKEMEQNIQTYEEQMFCSYPACLL